MIYYTYLKQHPDHYLLLILCPTFIELFMTTILNTGVSFSYVCIRPLIPLTK